MMTSPASTPTQPDVAHPQYLVLVFDVCSSTIVLEDLSRSQSVWRWRQLLADLLKYISNQPGVIVYKFVGDGWFILMPHDIKGDALISFCSDLISTLSNAYEANIKPVMENPLTSLGLTIGIDSGTLHQFNLGSATTEYVGRPLNVAARLQAAVKVDNPNYKNCALTTNKIAQDKKLATSEHIEVTSASRTLPNLTGGQQFACTLIRFRTSGAA